MARGAHHLLAGNEKPFYFQQLFTKCLKIDIMLIEQALELWKGSAFHAVSA
jgi:hypothetical protein